MQPTLRQDVVLGREKGKHAMTADYVTYDRDADALYVTFPGKEDVRVTRTDCIAEDLNIDYDQAGEVVGIEVLGVSTLPPPPIPHEDNA
jgi:uncharacterized protein YuzE